MAGKKSGGALKGVLAGAGLALAAATGLFLYKTKPEDRRKVLKQMIARAKKKTLTHYKKVAHKGEAGYKMAVAKVLREYKGVKNIDAKELALLGRELKSHWRRIKKSVATGRQKR